MTGLWLVFQRNAFGKIEIISFYISKCTRNICVSMLLLRNNKSAVLFNIQEEFGSLMQHLWMKWSKDTNCTILWPCFSITLLHSVGASIELSCQRPESDSACSNIELECTILLQSNKLLFIDTCGDTSLQSNPFSAITSAVFILLLPSQ